MGRGPIALIIVVVATVLFAGCGGDDSSSSANSISKEEFIAKANAVCKRSNKRMEVAFAKFLKANRDIKKPTDPALQQLVGDVMVPSIKREIEELRALGIPDGDEEKVEAMVSALEEGLETAEDNPKVVTSTSSDTIFGIASRIASEYGLETCGSR
jgi:hypothetical protein